MSTESTKPCDPRFLVHTVDKIIGRRASTMGYKPFKFVKQEKPERSSTVFGCGGPWWDGVSA
jgi:hypothetical protein